MWAARWGHTQATPGPANGGSHIKVFLMGQGEAGRDDVQSKGM